jgi:hypothetical protein
MRRVALAAVFSLSSLSGAAFADGRIVVAHDEWTLSNNGFSSAPATPQFVTNVANWFTHGVPGNFRAWSNNWGFTQSSLAQTMTNAGHSWTVSVAGTFDLATLQQYDAVFLGCHFTGTDAAVLTAYVHGGGNVYLCAGAGGAAAAATNWNPFLANFGLAYASVFNGFAGLEPISNSHPIFAGVSGLYENNGNSITDTTPGDPSSLVLVSESGQGIYAVYDGAQPPAAYCTAKVNSLGCTPAIGSIGWPSASGATPFTISVTSVLNQKQGLFFYGFAQQITPFQGGFKCMASPTVRTPVQGSGGSAAPANDCSGSYAIDFRAWIGGGSDPQLVAGQEVDGQFWSRDPASASTTGLSDAITFVIGS